MSIDPRFQLIETAVDARALSAEVFNAWPAPRALVEAFDSGAWAEVAREFRSCWQMPGRTPAERAFFLQWAVAATDIQYDIAARERLMALWQDLPGWAAAPFARYLRLFQEAVGYFFEGALMESESRFNRALAMAEAYDYPRAKMRCLFHLGLVARDRSEDLRAAKLFEGARRFAESLGAVRMLERIDAELGCAPETSRAADPHGSLAPARKEIEDLLRARNFTAARRRLASAESERRRLRLGRRSESLHLYQAILLEARGVRSARQSARSVVDPVVRLRWLELRRNCLGRSVEQDHEEEWFAEMLGRSRLIERPLGRDKALEVCGVPLNRVPRADVRRLVEILAEASQPVSKEELCRQIWGVSYDPVCHDGRLYKLLHSARVFFGKRDLFSNRYGAYQLNVDQAAGLRRGP